MQNMVVFDTVFEKQLKLTDNTGKINRTNTHESVKKLIEWQYF